MAKKRQSWWREHLASVIIAAIGAGGLITVGTIQAADSEPEPLSCYVVRGEVLDQAEQNPGTLGLPYPKNSREEEECEINEFITEIATDQSAGASG